MRGARLAIAPKGNVLVFVGLVFVALGCGGQVAAEMPADPPDDSIAGVVFLDDGDGVLDGDSAAVGVEVVVRNTHGTIVGEVTTDDAGHWQIDQLPAKNDPYTATVVHDHDGARWGVRQIVARAEATALAYTPAVACEACPIEDFPLPDLVPMMDIPPAWAQDGYPGPAEFVLDTESNPGRTLMRIGTSTANRGDAPLVVVGLEPGDDTQPVVQRLIDDQHRYRDLEAGTFVFHPGHDHVHLDRFEIMELVDPVSGVTVAASKQSFCLTDVLPAEGTRPATSNGELVLELTPWQCGDRAQGINVGWADYYGPELPDQYIDVTDVDPGQWLLRITVDPDDLLVELDETNNRIELAVEIP